MPIAGSHPRAIMYAQPWALYDMGVDKALDELSSCGIDAIQLALTYHVATFLTPRNQHRKVHFGEQGALYFEALEDTAQEWPFPPPVSRLVDRPAYAGTILEAAGSRGVSAIGWVVYLYNHVLAQTHPHLAVHNAYGDVNWAQLCPANPEVRAYALVLTRAALALGQFDRLHVESLSYLPYDYGFLGTKAAIVPGQLARELLGLCFCRHCRAEALACGIDVGRLELAVRKWLEDELNRLPDGRPSETSMGPQDELHAFTTMREEVVLGLHLQVFELASKAGVRVSSNLAEDVKDGTQAGFRLRGAVDALRVRVQPDLASEDIERALARVMAGARAQVPVYAFYNLAQFGTQHSFRSAVESAKAAGLSHHGFYEFSILSERQVDWLSGNGLQ
ncbi:MAG: hypothetical protein WD273_04200 [Trueperaceae bacterium]